MLLEIKNRTSPLFFEQKAVEKEKIEIMLEAARLAPSSRNNQPWRYLVVNEKSALKKADQGIVEGNFWAKQAPVIIIVFSKPSLDDEADGKQYYLYDAGLSVMSLVVEAEHQGISVHQMLGFKEDILKNNFAVPSDWRVVVVMAVGYKADVNSSQAGVIAKFGMSAFEKLRSRLLSPRARKDIEEIVCFNEFGF